MTKINDVDIQALLYDELKKIDQERGQFTVLVAGRSGVGKSTLINTVFSEQLASVGQGKPVTQHTREYRKEGFPVTFLDTRGLEMKAYNDTIEELRDEIRRRQKRSDPNEHIHVAWLCIHEDGRRVEDGEVALHELLHAENIPTITVITKARADGGFKDEVKNLLPYSRNTVRVRALSEELDGGHVLPPQGLSELVGATNEVIPEGQRTAFATAQKVNANLKKAAARKYVYKASTAATAAAATPIPFSDAIALAPIQIAMFAGISSVYHVDLTASALATIASGALGVSSATVGGRMLVTGLLKLIPSAGSVIGGTIAAGTAGLITTTLGTAYIEVLARMTAESSGEFDAKTIRSALVDELKKA